MVKIIDHTSAKFGRLTVLKRDGSRFNKPLWLCQCECGNIKHITSSTLSSGKSNSCGCLQKEITSKIRATHGKSKTVEYKTWCQMRERCTNPTLDRWMHYGGRGITVCDRWMHSFENFFQDMGARPSPLHSIDRFDNNGNYCPENCRWATRSEQQANKQPASAKSREKRSAIASRDIVKRKRDPITGRLLPD